MAFTQMVMPRMGVRLLLRPALAGLVVVGSLVALAQGFHHAYPDTCHDVPLYKYCLTVEQVVRRGLGLCFVLIVFALARPAAAAPVLQAARASLPLGFAPWLLGLGPALILSPVAALADGTELFPRMVAWSLGALLVTLGSARLLAPWEAWGRALAAGGLPLAVLAGLALLLPEISYRISGLWQIDAITRATFSAVIWLSDLVGMTVTADASTHMLGHGDFFIKVNQSCSGIEGLALISTFLGGYLWLFRRQLAFPQVLVILPLALAMSWCLNVVRITGLAWIGLNVSPELAVEGFHSHAGWLMFSVLAVGSIFAVQSIPWFQRTTAPAAGRGSRSGTAPPAPGLERRPSSALRDLHGLGAGRLDLLRRARLDLSPTAHRHGGGSLALPPADPWTRLARRPRRARRGRLHRDRLDTDIPACRI